MIKMMKLFAIMMVASLLLFASGFAQARTAEPFQIESKPIQFPTEPFQKPGCEGVSGAVPNPTYLSSRYPRMQTINSYVINA